MAPAAFHRQFWLLTWKNWLTCKRHYIATAFKIAIPLLVGLHLVLIARTCLPSSLNNTTSDATGVIPASQEPPWDPLRENACPLNRSSTPKTPIYYVPASSPYASKLMEKAVVELFGLGFPPTNTTHGFYMGLATEDDLEAQVLKDTDNTGPMLAVVFDNVSFTPTELKYRIRSSEMRVSKQMYPTSKKPGPNPDDGDYVCSGFLALQAAIERSHTELLSGKSPSAKVLLQPFPYPEYTAENVDGRTEVLFTVSSILLILSLAIQSPVVALRIVEEKKHKAKEMLRLVGMNDFPYWLFLFVSNFLFAVVLSIIMVVFFKVPFKKDAASVLQHADGSVLFVLLLLCSASSIACSMAVTPFFKSSEWAANFNVIVFLLLTYLIPIMILDYGKHMVAPLVKLATCLLPNMALHWAYKVIAAYESKGIAIGWSNLFDSPTPDDKTSIGLIMMALLASIPMYLIILWYCDAVWPWQDGVPKPFYFPFQKSYWLSPGGNSVFQPVADVPPNVSSDFEESPPSNLVPDISIMALTKVFGRGSTAKVAVKNASLTVYSDQITALLGHTGAGKTTIMNMIIGMFTPTSGTVQVSGYDILRETKAARRRLGYCPQQDVLYGELTVSEHLAFFAGMKGCPSDKLKEQVDETLRILQLEDKKDEFAKNLSSSMKRKLCLGIAFIGGSKVLILDEPMSGMYPDERREVWDLLLRIREGRTILLATHIMEEADVLGDRIAIIVDGEIKCCGSPAFLKRKFGAGYLLHVAKGLEGCIPDQVTSLIRRHLPNSTLESKESTQLLYALGEEYSSKFPSLLEDLQKSKAELGISTFRVSITTMEDVFFKVSHMGQVPSDSAAAAGQSFPKSLPLTGRAIFAQQLKGLLLKRVHYAKRHWSILVFQVLFPCAVWILLLAMTSDKDGGLLSSTRPTDLDLEGLFGHTVAFHVSERNTLADEYYVPLLQSKTKEVKKVDNATSYLLGIAERDMQEYLRKHITGGEFPPNGNFVISWYNAEPYHTTPIALSLMDSALLRMVTGNSSAVFKVANHPLPSKHVPFANPLKYKILFSHGVPLALTFLSSSFVVFPIHERASKAKLLQLMCGPSSFVFWGASFLWDFAVHLVVCLLLMVSVFAFDSARIFVSSSTNMGVLFALLMLYGWCSVPFAYLVSLAFERTDVGFSAFSFFNYFLGQMFVEVMTSLQPVLYASYNLALNIMRLLPIFSITWGIENLQSLRRTSLHCKSIKPLMLSTFCAYRDMAIKKNVLPCCAELCKGDECVDAASALSMSIYGCGQDMVFLLLMGLLFFLTLVLLDANYINFSYALQAPPVRCESYMDTTWSFEEDHDVAAERVRIENLFACEHMAEEAMVVRNLTKIFGTFAAVKRVTFGVHKKECFGLLGISGAGKTTLARMLTGDLTLSYGNAYIDKYDLRASPKKFQAHVGYCPQIDPLLDRLTGLEMLYLFARLRGVEEDSIELMVSHLVKTVDLEKDADKVTKNYGAGNRRKLSLALALIGCPPIAILDEPTCGVAPPSRRKIWSALTEHHSMFRTSIVLTSESMEECEALCSRLAILAHGHICCLGDLQHLRTKFAQGYTIIAKLKREADADAVEKAKTHFKKEFPSAVLEDEHRGFVRYFVSDTNWSKLFSKMEAAKKRFELEEFVVSNNTLEKVFFTFAKLQRHAHDETETEAAGATEAD